MQANVDGLRADFVSYILGGDKLSEDQLDTTQLPQYLEATVSNARHLKLLLLYLAGSSLPVSSLAVGLSPIGGRRVLRVAWRRLAFMPSLPLLRQYIVGWEQAYRNSKRPYAPNYAHTNPEELVKTWRENPMRRPEDTYGVLRLLGETSPSRCGFQQYWGRQHSPYDMAAAILDYDKCKAQQAQFDHRAYYNYKGHLIGTDGQRLICKNPELLRPAPPEDTLVRFADGPDATFEDIQKVLARADAIYGSLTVDILCPRAAKENHAPAT